MIECGSDIFYILGFFSGMGFMAWVNTRVDNWWENKTEGRDGE